MHVQLLLAFAGLSAIAHAQFNGLPKCAQACVGNSLVDFGCSNYNPKCICENKDLIAALACCVGKSCSSQSDIQDTETFANQICKPYAVTLPTAATCASGVSVLPTGTGSVSSTASTPATATATATATSTAGSAAGNGTAVTTSASSSTAQSTAGAPVQTMHAGLGAAAIGLLAVL